MLNHTKVSLLLGLIFLAMSPVLAEETHEDHEKWSRGQGWLYGILSSIAVSLLGIVMTLVLVCILRAKKISKSELDRLCDIMIAFAIGALLGDAFIHILPEIFGAHDHSHGEEDHEKEESAKPDPRITSLMLLLGILFFILFDKVVGHAHSHEHPHDHSKAHSHSHQHKHIHAHQKVKQECKKSCDHEDIEVKDKENNAKQTDIENGSTNPVVADAALIVEPSNSGDLDKKVKSDDQLALEHSHDSKPHEKPSLKAFFNLKGKKSEGLMILLADFIHNIMDGLAIGAAFASGNKSVAISTFVAIVAHEIPHELGDMGILIYSKFPIWQAVFCNGISNLTAIIGAVIGLGIGHLSEKANAYIFGVVAGNFMYISLADMMPAALKQEDKKTCVWMLLAAIVGTGIMYIVLAIEESTE
jgi:Predicted divalent heavy-metal cations transporter